MISNDEFIKLVKEAKEIEKINNFIDEHELDDIIKLLIKDGGFRYKEFINNLINNSPKKISFSLLLELLNQYIYTFNNNSPSYMFEDMEYVQVLLTKRVYFIEYFSEEYLTNEVVDLAIEKGFFNINSTYDKYPIVHNKYFILKLYEMNQSYAQDIIMKKLKENNHFFTNIELEHIIDMYCERNTNISNFCFSVAFYKPELYFKLLQKFPSSIYSNMNKLNEDYLKDESNGFVYKLIDSGYRLGFLDLECIKNNEHYIDYMLDCSIKNNENLLWLSRCGDLIIDNIDNGIISKAIKKGYSNDSRLFNYIEYILEMLEYQPLSTIIGLCPKYIVEDPTNGVVIKAIDKGLNILNASSNIITTKKEYILEYIKINGNQNINFLLKDVEFIDDEIFSLAIKNGYVINNLTPSYIKSNSKWMALATKGHPEYIAYIDPQLFLDINNGILLNALDSDLKYDKKFDDILFSHKEYLKKFIMNSNFWVYDELLNRASKEALLNEDIYYLAIDYGYRYTKTTNPLFLKPKYILYYISKYEYIGYFDNLPEILPQELLQDATNGIVMTLIDRGYIFSNKTNPIILENKEYLKYYVMNSPKNSSSLLKLFSKEKILNEDNNIVYDLLNSGYFLDTDTPIEILSNINYVTYAAKLKRIRTVKCLNVEINESLAYLLIINQIPDSQLIASQYNLELLYALVFDRFISSTLKEQDISKYTFVKDYLKTDLIKELSKFPLEYKNNYEYLLYSLTINPNVIDLADINLIDENLIALALQNNYSIKDKDRFNKYIEIFGINKILLYYPDIIEVYTIEDFQNLGYDYKMIISAALDKGYNYKKTEINLPPALNNYCFVNKIIDHNCLGVLHFIGFEIDVNLLNKAIDRGLSICLLNNNIKSQIINNEELFQKIIEIKNVNKIVSILEIFLLTNSFDNSKVDIVFNLIKKEVEIDSKKIFLNNIKYLYNHNKELFINLDVNILAKKYSFLDIETLNRIIPDPNIVAKILRINDKSKLLIFNLLVNYLYSLDLDINVNDLLYKIVNNLSNVNFNIMCDNLVKEWKNIDVFVKLLQENKFNKKHIIKLDNLITTILLNKNVYQIETNSDLDHNIYMKKKETYFNNLSLSNNIKDIKSAILLKYYNIDYESAEFIYQRYCYMLTDINYLKNDKIKCLLNDLKFLFECEELEPLQNVYNNIYLNPIDFDYAVILEGLIRNEYIDAYNNVLLKEPTIKLNDLDNVYEIDKDFHMLVHVLGGYNHAYVEPNNFKEAWNIELMQNHGICTSYLSDQNLTTANRRYPTLGFVNLEPNSILLAEPDDIASNGLNIKFATSLQKACRFLLPKRQVDETRWHHNEVVLERKKLSKKTSEEYKRQPDYVIYIAENDDILDNNELDMESIKKNDLWRMTVKCSKDFNVPILIVNRVKISNKERAELLNMQQDIFKNHKWSLINDVIVRYMNNLMGKKSYFAKEELFDFMDKCLSLVEYQEKEDAKIILEKLLYSIEEENRKFKAHKTDDTFNYVGAYEEIVREKLEEITKYYRVY